MLALVTTWIVVALHVGFALAESVGWSKMARSFGLGREATETTRSLAMNQGAYNAGLAAVLAWALVTGRPETVVAMLVYVVAMAIVGAVTVRWTIFVVQGVPAVIALAATALG